MIRKRNNDLFRLFKIVDILVTAGTFALAYYIKKHLLPVPLGGLTTGPNYYMVLLLVLVSWYPVFDIYGLHQTYRPKALREILFPVVKVVSSAMMVHVLLLYVFNITDISRIMLGIFYLLNVIFLLGSRLCFQYLSKVVLGGPYNQRNVIIVGSRNGAMDVITAMEGFRGNNYKLVGCVETDGSRVGLEVKDGVKVIGTMEILKSCMVDNVVDELIFAMPLNDIPNVDEYLAAAEEIGVAVRILPQWAIRKNLLKSSCGCISVDNFFGIPTLTCITTPAEIGALMVKNVAEYAMAIVLAAVFFLPGLLAAAAIKAISPGPVLYVQERCGLNGRRFRFYKFRTMVRDADARRGELENRNECDGPVFKMRDDPRIIPFIGKFMRKTGFDELPQLINVLRGEMGIVGPRPPIPSEVAQYDAWQRRRLSMKPGITCLWQVTPSRNCVDFNEWMRMDLEYIDNWSLLLDLRILVRTFFAVMKAEGL